MAKNYEAEEIQQGLAGGLPWATYAACVDEDPDLFIGPTGEPAAERQRRENAARAVCYQCGVIEPCLQDALEHKDKTGVRGGKGVRDLQKLLRQIKDSDSDGLIGG